MSQEDHSLEFELSGFSAGAGALGGTLADELDSAFPGPSLASEFGEEGIEGELKTLKDQQGVRTPTESRVVVAPAAAHKVEDHPQSEESEQRAPPHDERAHMPPSDTLLDKCGSLCTDMDVVIDASMLCAHVWEKEREGDTGDAAMNALLIQLQDDAQERGTLLHELRRQVRQLEFLWERRRQELSVYEDAAATQRQGCDGIKNHSTHAQVLDDIRRVFWNEAAFHACLETPACCL